MDGLRKHKLIADGRRRKHDARRADRAKKEEKSMKKDQRNVRYERMKYTHPEEWQHARNWGDFTQLEQHLPPPSKEELDDVWDVTRVRGGGVGRRTGGGGA